MKNKTDYTLLALAIPFAIAVLSCLPGCYKTKAKPTNFRDYQIDLYMDTVKVYDGERLVGSYISTLDNQIDSILLKDNQ